MAITNKDIDKLKEVFATKSEMNSSFAMVDKRFDQIDKRFEQVDKRFDEIASTLNWLVNDFRKFQDEFTIRFAQYRRHDDQLEVHEVRIKKLEERVFV